MTDLAEAVRRQVADDALRLVSSRRRSEVRRGTWSLADLLPLDERHGVALLVDPGGSLRPSPVVVAAGRARRAVPGDGTAAALLAACRDGVAADTFDLQVRHPALSGDEGDIDVDQTNESVLVGDCVVKWFAVSSDEHPAPQRVLALDSAGFDAMPKPYAFLWWRRADRRYLVASVTERLREASDGWTWCVTDARAYAAGERTLDDAVAPAATVGAVVARMHVAFAGSGECARASAKQVSGWHAEALKQLQTARNLVDGVEGERLVKAEQQIRAKLDQMLAVQEPITIPVHGDLHVGQVLQHRNVDGAWAYALTDFDGNPVLSPTQRTLPQPAARDVAGYLQSLDHVGRVLMRGTDEVDESAVRIWMRAAQETFLSAYRRTLKASGAENLLDARLLMPFAVEQECREFVYAVRHLPHWRYVADAALGDLVR